MARFSNILHRSHTMEPSGHEEEINFSATAAEDDRRRPDSSAPHLFPSSLNHHFRGFAVISFVSVGLKIF